MQINGTLNLNMKELQFASVDGTLMLNGIPIGHIIE